jgi:hypothetical protein
MKEAYYLSDLKQIIAKSFPSCAAFCKATRLPRKGVADLLAGRADFPAGALEQGLKRIGYRLHFSPTAKAK